MWYGLDEPGSAENDAALSNLLFPNCYNNLGKLENSFDMPSLNSYYYREYWESDKNPGIWEH